MPTPVLPAFSTFFSKSLSAGNLSRGVPGDGLQVGPRVFDDDVEEDEVLRVEVGQAVGLTGAGHGYVSGPDHPGVTLAVGEDPMAGDDHIRVLVVLVRMDADELSMPQGHPPYFLDGVVLQGRVPREGELAVKGPLPPGDVLLVEHGQLLRGIALAMPGGGRRGGGRTERNSHHTNA